MAKGSLNGLLKGKLGNTIFYKVTNSADKEKQGSRQYVASIANPQTAPQATQRMRMKPAINFYRGIADLLDHSWEGVKYGALSRQKFMQLALSPTLTGIPYVDKGESRFIPGDYPISLGSVGVDTQSITFSSDNDEEYGTYGIVRWGLIPSFRVSDGSYGAFSSAIIAAVGGALRDGDEITFVVCTSKNGFYNVFHSYIVLDTTSSLDQGMVFGRAGFEVRTNGDIALVKLNGDASFIVRPTSDTGEIVAAGIIVSRHPSRTSTTWLRSTSNLVCSPSFIAQWMSADRFAAAQATYMKSATDLTSDWLLNQAENQQASQGGGGGGLIQNFTIEQKPVTPSGQAVAIQLAYYNDGTNEGFIADAAEASPTTGFILNKPYTVAGQALTSHAAVTVPAGTKYISFEENPSIYTKIKAYYSVG